MVLQQQQRRTKCLASTKQHECYGARQKAPRCKRSSGKLSSNSISEGVRLAQTAHARSSVNPPSPLTSDRTPKLSSDKRTSN